ncbi:MAG: DNA primase [Lachnospiraceae bacterium]|nr:DNA primase [Lachnospiraceae bacterium]
MYYPDEIIEEVRSKNDIVDIVSGYVRLQKKGANYVGLCPFHNEKTGSFMVSSTKQMFYCFGCHTGGNVITFLMKHENATFKEAIEKLADRAGVKLPELKLNEEQKKQMSEKSILLEINKEAAKYFYYQLRGKPGELGMKYFTDRKLSSDTINSFGLGFSLPYSDDLVKYLKQKGYADELIVKAGLASHDEKRGTHDKFWNRVMFPIQDINHRVIGFGGRVMGEGEPKYLNSPETPIFDKSRNLFGLNFARSSRKDYLILCEGYMDVISMHQAGFKEAVASLGTAFTSGQANLLKRFCNSVILSYDSDGAGTNAALRAIGILREVELTAKVLDLNPYKDPDEFIKNLGSEKLQERIDNAKNSFFFEIEVLERGYDLKDPDSKTAFYREIAKRICGFSDEVERNNYIDAICERYSISTDAMKKMVIGYAAAGISRPIEQTAVRTAIKKADPEEGRKRSQRLLITWISEDSSIFDKISPYISPHDFTDEMYKKIAEKLFESLKEDNNIEPASFISAFEDEEDQKKVAELFNTKLLDSDGLPAEIDDIREREKTLHDILVSVKTGSLEYYSRNIGSDPNAITRVVEGKKLLEELKKTKIKLG